MNQHREESWQACIFRIVWATSSSVWVRATALVCVPAKERHWSVAWWWRRFFFPETQSRNLWRIGFHFSGIREVIVSFMQKIRFHFCGVSWVRIRNWNEMGEIKCKFWVVLASSLAGKLANTQKMIVLMLEVMRGWFINSHCTKWVLSFSKAIWGIGEEIR